MEAQSPKSRFLERNGYRQRRLRDVARMLPIVGGIFWTIPLLWSENETNGVSNATALIYIFGIWIIVIVLTAIISKLLKPGAVPEETEAPRK